MRAGFSGGLVVDFPHSTRAKKYFLVLMVGPSSTVPHAKGIDGANSDQDADDAVDVIERQPHKRRKCSLPADKARYDLSRWKFMLAGLHLGAACGIVPTWWQSDAYMYTLSAMKMLWDCRHLQGTRMPRASHGS